MRENDTSIEVQGTSVPNNSIIRKISNYFVGVTVIRMPQTEASLRRSSVDAQAFNRLRNLPDDADINEVLVDLDKVIK